MSVATKHPVVIFAHLYERGREVFDSPKYAELQFIKSHGRDEKNFLKLVHKNQAQAVVLDSKPFNFSVASSSELPRLDRDFFSELLPGSIVMRFGSGVDNIPLSHCIKLGHKIVAIPNSSTDSVCEYVFTALGLLSRRLLISHHALANTANWIRPVGSTLGSNKTLAVLGFGNIGKAVALTAIRHHHMKVKVLIETSTLKEKQDELKQIHDFTDINKYITFSEDLASVLTSADFISVHLSLTHENEFIINQKSLSYTKPGAILINTSRGKHLEETDVCKALLENQLGGAAIDVFPTEPYTVNAGNAITADLEEFAYHALAKKNLNLLLTSHIAANTTEANHYTAEAVARNLTNYFRGDFAKLDLVLAKKE